MPSVSVIVSHALDKSKAPAKKALQLSQPFTIIPGLVGWGLEAHCVYLSSPSRSSYLKATSCHGKEVTPALTAIQKAEPLAGDWGLEAHCVCHTCPHVLAI